MAQRKINSPTKYIQANFTECDGVDMLSVFLRRGKRLFPNFSSNEKRTIYDGDLDYLDEKGTIKKVFRCQIKSLSHIPKKYNIEYKYLFACSNKISLDPLFFFLVDTTKPKFYYLNLTTYHPREMEECIKKRISLEANLSDFTELNSASDLVTDIESNYLYSLSLAELNLEELRILMSGITYLNNSINSLKLFKDALFPDFYSFVVEYDKNTNEGVESGFFAGVHNVLSILPVSADSKTDLIKKYNSKTLAGKFVCRTFGERPAIAEQSFKDYMGFLLKEAFHHNQYLITIMPDDIIFELIYAAVNYEFFMVPNNGFYSLVFSEKIDLDTLRSLIFHDDNPYKIYIPIILDECRKRNISEAKKIWKYWEKCSRYGLSLEEMPEFVNETKWFFKKYSLYSNIILNRLFGDNYGTERSYDYSLECSRDTKSLTVTFWDKCRFDSLVNGNHDEHEGSTIMKKCAFENMMSFSPLFGTLVNKCYLVASERFGCSCDKILIDGTQYYVP